MRAASIVTVVRAAARRALSARTVTWGALAVLMFAVLAASLRALEPPAPLPRQAPLQRFSEGRARELVRRLSEEIGVRVNGTPAHARAAELLAGELRKVPRLEVELQDVSDTQVYRSVKLPPFVYRTLNVVARLPGRSAEAILLDAHFDTLVDSVGAADDAAGVAAIVEAVRVLAGEAPLAHTLVINLNGGEEAGLFGAAGFLRHRWAADVRAYLYLEALPGGKAGLLGAGPGHAWLARTYARVAPAPLANVVGQELAQSGLLPHNGDFTPFHEAGLRGLDVAMTGDGWAYHTALDRADRLQEGGLQHMGDTAVAVTRALASGPLPGPNVATLNAESVVYYDLLGLTMVVYPAKTARLLAVVALVLVGVVLALLGRRGLISPRGTLFALAWILAAVVAGLLAALAAGLSLGVGLRRPHGWFSAPGLIVPAFAAPALAAMFGVHALWRRRWSRRGIDGERLVFIARAGALLFWSLALAATAVGNVKSGYLALHWVAGGAAGLLGSLLWPRARVPLGLLGLVPGAVVTVELGVVFLKYFVPITGLLPAAMPLDFLVAALVGMVVVAVGVAAFTLPQAVGGFGRAALVCLGVAGVGLALTATRFPYTAARPKRLILAHAADGHRSSLLLASADALGMASVAPFVHDFGPARSGWPPFEAWSPPFTHEKAAAPPPALPPPRIVVTVDGYDAASDTRQLGVRVSGADAQLRLAVPSARLLAWSLAPSLDDTLAVAGNHIAHFEGLDAEGHELSLTIAGRAPLPIELRAIGRRPADGPLIEAVKRRLPPWTTTTTVSVRIVRQAL